jgi:hypothetical protein
MSFPLSSPTEELARRILGKVAYQDRLPAGRLAPRLGITRGSVRGLPELYLYLTPDDRTLPALSLERLAGWVEQIIADGELAVRIRTAVDASASYVDGCINVRELVGQRIEQARESLGQRAGETCEVKEA